MTLRNQSIRGTSQVKDYQKPGCNEFTLTFVPKGGLRSSTNLLSQIRLFVNKVLSKVGA